ALGRLEDPRADAALELRYLGVREECSSGCLHLFREACAHGLVVDDPRLRHPDRLDAVRVRLELRETRAVDLLAADAVRHAALVDLLERGKLGLIDRDDHLAADLEGDFLSLAELLHRELSLAAIHRLERTGLVIDPRKIGRASCR